MARKHYLVIFVATVVVAIVILGAWSIYEVTESVTDAYSMECMSLVVVEHLSTEAGWPTSYEDLADDYQVVLKRTGGVGPWSEVCNRVNVDFGIDIETAASDTRFITLRSGRQAELSNPHPNERISTYLREVAQAIQRRRRQGSHGQSGPDMQSSMSRPEHRQWLGHLRELQGGC